MFDILRSVTFIATFASRAKSIAHVHDVHESLMFLPDCTLAFRGIFSSENKKVIQVLPGALSLFLGDVRFCKRAQISKALSIRFQ